MTETMTYTGTLVIETCWCGIAHAIPSDLRRWAHQSKENVVYCPLGHRWVVRETEANRLKTQLDQANDQLQAATADAEALRVRLLRDRQRYANGVCPCCNRSFPALARHMKTEHPDYDPTHVEGQIEFGCSCGRKFQSYHGLRIHQGRSRSEDWLEPKTSRWRAHLTSVEGS